MVAHSSSSSRTSHRIYTVRRDSAGEVIPDMRPGVASGAGTSNSSPSRRARISTPATLADYADLKTIANSRVESGYECVYRHGRLWRARVLKRINLGMYPTVLDAARAVVNWYRSTYGDLWKSVWDMRRSKPWEIVKVKSGGQWAYVSWVWFAGAKMRLRLCDVKKRPMPGDERIYVWPSAEEARRMIQRWIYFRVGLFAPILLYRVGRGSVKG